MKHRAGQRCFELLALIGSPQLSFSKVFPAEQTSWPNWQTLMACSKADEKDSWGLPMRAKSSKQRCPALCFIDLSYNVKYHWSCRVGGCSGHLTASGSWHGFPGVDHEGRQDVAVLISVVTQRGVLVVRIAYGCPYYKDPAIFHLFLKYHKWKIVYSLLNHVPCCNPLRFAS